jgi:hypothetical protein
MCSCAWFISLSMMFYGLQHVFQMAASPFVKLSNTLSYGRMYT